MYMLAGAHHAHLCLHFAAAATALVRLRLPDGGSAQRRFLASDHLGSVFDFVDSLDTTDFLKYASPDHAALIVALPHLLMLAALQLPSPDQHLTMTNFYCLTNTKLLPTAIA